MKYYNAQLPETEKVAQNLFILIKTERVEIKPEEIIYMQADINYTNFVTLNRRFTTAFHLGFFEKSLETHPYLVRISKSFIVNINYLKDLRWQKVAKEARLLDGTSLPISRRRAKELKDVLWQKINFNA